MKRNVILGVPVLLSIMCSCRTPGERSGLAAAGSLAPAKPNDLPISTVRFINNDMIAITDHGDSVCKILEKDKTEDFVRIAQKLCDSNGHWLGYTASDGLKNQNELFIGNRDALTNLGGKISTVAGERNNIAIQRLAFLEIKMFRDDLALISGDKIKKFENDMQLSNGSSDTAAQYASFSRWVMSLNDHYMKYGKQPMPSP